MKHNFYHTEQKNGIPFLVKEERSYEADKRLKYDSPQVIYDLCNGINLTNMAEEYVYAVFLNTALRLIGFTEISHGTVNMSMISSREIFQKALLMGATNIIVIHNHPSGDITPSKNDVKVTHNLLEAGKLLGIQVLDHVIVSTETYYSFKLNKLI